jgi:mRNA (guanine-N7-)-methyltransferase
MSDTHSNPASPRSNSYNNASAVAEHYDKKSTEVRSDLASRSLSPIYYLRNFNNWVKSVLINEFITRLRNDENSSVRDPSVLDLGCGKGGDILKWKKANVSHVTFADISEQSLEICRDRYHNPRRANFTAKFVHLDATRDALLDRYDQAANDIVQHDLVSSQFVLHYSFESFAQADRFMKNVSDSLRPGGFFIGTTTNGAELVKRLREANSNAFGNDVFNIKFDDAYKESESAQFDLFGVKFDFQLETVVECPEFLVNFDCLVKIAKRHSMSLVFKNSFSEYFEAKSANNEYRSLITTMQALEPYYPKKKVGQESEQFRRPGDYDYIESLINDEASLVRSEPLNEDEAFATLSKSEWEVATLYLVFGFVKDLPSETNGSQGSQSESSRQESEANEEAEREKEAAAESDRENDEDDEEQQALEIHTKRKLDDLNTSTDSHENEAEPSKKK